MNTTPRGFRPHLAVFGRRNVGKSSFLNALTRQPISIVSPVPGTTTDPVEKAMELLPLGPVVLVDTAGLDDIGELGGQRVARTWRVLEKTDVAVLVADAGAWGPAEEETLAKFAAAKIPALVALNKADLAAPDPALEARLKAQGVRSVRTVATTGQGLDEFRRALLETVPEELLQTPTIVGDLIQPGAVVVLVVPIDLEAPKGRIILPQVQTIRDVLDSDAICLVTKERELRHALDRLAAPPALVVTDSQAFLKVAADTPPDVPMTSFSILFARLKGDLETMVQGVLAIDRLHPGDRILVAEACTHHPVGDDIGRVKIPRWLAQHVGGELKFDTFAGPDFPADLSSYQLVIHCGACMFNRRAVLSRILRCQQAGVPITNYGLTIAHVLGLLPRALMPFPAACRVYTERKSS